MMSLFGGELELLGVCPFPTNVTTHATFSRSWSRTATKGYSWRLAGRRWEIVEIMVVSGGRLQQRWAARNQAYDFYVDKPLCRHTRSLEGAAEIRKCGGCYSAVVAVHVGSASSRFPFRRFPFSNGCNFAVVAIPHAINLSSP
jgi:hypothetical protein